MDTLLLYGETPRGTLAVIVRDATWATVASVADSLQAICRDPIRWEARKVAEGTSLHQAMGAAGLLDRQPVSV